MLLLKSLIFYTVGPAMRRTGRVIPILILLLAPRLQALELRVYSTERHDRFTGAPAVPVPSTTFIHKDVDLTGVGWRAAGSAPRALTLVSPKFFVGARHYRPSVGNTIRFVAADGTVRNYSVKAYYNILNDDSEATDLSLGELQETVASTDGVNFQTYLNLPTEAAYLAPPNNQLIVLGKTFRGGNGTANAITDFFGDPVTSGGGINNTRTMGFVYQTAGGAIDDAHVEIGDSGGPSLVNVNNRGAIVGIHTAVLTASGTTTSIDSFVAHPPYIAQINTIMSAEGYHMTEANPESISLTLTPTVPTVIRAGYEATILFEISNADLINDANNLKVAYAFPATSTGVAATGTQWLADPTGASTSARRSGLAEAQSTTLSTTFTAPAPSTFNLSVAYSADEFSEAVEIVPIEVIESYLSWSSDLSNVGPDADDDLDGISNLLEYAFGGDPAVSSVYQADGVTRLGPTTASGPNENESTVEFVQRKDAAQRALTYDLDYSLDLTIMIWMDASSKILQTSTTSLDDDFERVTLTIEDTADKIFYRVSVILSESE